MKKTLIMSIGFAWFIGMAGCIKPYNEQQYEDVANNETAFVIPLDEDTSKQVQLQSVEQLEQKKVLSKRIPIPRRFHQTGRWSNLGEWIPTVRIIKINRAPVTRIWTADETTGTSNKDEAIWVESQDSIGFSMGVTCTAQILEENTALFLYKYSANQLANMMDEEIQARIQQALSEQAQLYNLDEVRTKKGEMMAAVRDEILPFFAKGGVTITTLGMKGGLTYENPKIQDAIDKTVQDQQLKVSSLARQAAQTIDNHTMIEKQQAEAEAAKISAEGKANAAYAAAEGEARAVTIKADADAQAIEKVGGFSPYLAMKNLEVKMKQISSWDGAYPKWFMGNESPNMLLQISENTINDEEN